MHLSVKPGLYGSLEYISFNPVFAVQVTRSLSVGLGISANYINAQLRQGLTTMQGDYFSFKGDGLSVGGCRNSLEADRAAVDRV